VDPSFFQINVFWSCTKVSADEGFPIVPDVAGAGGPLVWGVISHDLRSLESIFRYANPDNTCTRNTRTREVFEVRETVSPQLLNSLNFVF